MIYIVLVVIFLHWYFREKEAQCVLIFANIGAGKTTLLARYAQRELKKIKKGKSLYKAVVSNTPISGCYYVKDIRQFIKETRAEHVLYLVDEAGIVWNNRKMKITDEEIEYIKLIRHYHSKLIAISQSYDDVDITIRRLYTNVYILNKILGITLIRPIKKYVTIDKETEQITDGYKFKLIFSWGVLVRRLYYKYFDTYWVPQGKNSADYESYEIIPYREKQRKKHYCIWRKLLNKIKNFKLKKLKYSIRKKK
jgi:hypothetical protein